MRASPTTESALPSALPLAIGALIAVLVLSYHYARTDTEFEDLALGTQTQTSIAIVDGDRIHCLGLGADAEECVAGARERARPGGEVLWLGNSQLHAINQLAEGDHTAPYYAHLALRQSERDLVAFSLPNASLQELYVLAEHLRHELPVRAIVLPAVFDDVRETGIRHRLEPAFESEATLTALRGTDTGRRLIRAREDARRAEAAGVDAVGPLTATTQEITESALNGWLEEHSAVWAARAEARGQLFTALYRFRNWIFRIDAQTVRPIIPARYTDNMRALADLLAQARAAGIRSVVYLAPLRDDVPPPYDPGEYQRFRDEVRALCEEHAATYVDLEHLVPAELWGLKDATTIGGEPELDFMHFQGEGHRLVADAILDTLR